MVSMDSEANPDGEPASPPSALRQVALPAIPADSVRLHAISGATADGPPTKPSQDDAAKS
jgi:hypothetical protein